MGINGDLGGEFREGVADLITIKHNTHCVQSWVK